MRISVFGLGYVGTVTAGCLTEQGHEVIGVDVQPEKVALFNRGQAPILEPGLDTLALFHHAFHPVLDSPLFVRACGSC